MSGGLFLSPAILSAIKRERARQEELRAGGRFAYTCASPTVLNIYKLPILTEEVGEVAKAICEKDADQLQTELIQVAAVAVAWLEALERK